MDESKKKLTPKITEPDIMDYLVDERASLSSLSLLSGH
jgi:hypothetical protein